MQKMSGSSSHSNVVENIAIQHKREVEKGERFEFGKNWRAFLSHLDDDRISRAENSLREMLEVDSLEGKTFLDIGSGSGLFSLAARRLGARVYSFDFDTNSFECTKELKKRYFASDNEWTVEQGSILDKDYVSSLGSFDIVYSWGVLHHTGDMWTALANASIPVKFGGQMFIAIYNDTGSQAERWKWIKSTYCRLPKLLKTPFAIAVSLPEEGKKLLSATATGKPHKYFRDWSSYRNERGMNRWHDIIDWVGGYPYEYAGPSALFEFYKSKGFSISKMNCDNVGLGCNEIVFRRDGNGEVRE